MFTIEGGSINEVWLKLLEELHDRPEHRPAPRGMTTHECLGVALRVTDLRNNLLYHPVRNLNYRFAVAEWLWIAYGLDDVATLARYNSQMARFSDDGLTLAGAYGPRLKTQWQYVVDSICKDYFSRQALATVWTPNPRPSKDTPCTVSLQVIARDGFLNGLVTMRSSDVWLGLPYDFFSFSQLVNSLAGVLGLKPGFLQFYLGSSHLYATDLAKAEAVLADPNQYQSLRSPALPYWPSENLLEEPYCLRDFLQEPKRHDPRYLRYPWSLYARALNADSWEQARLVLAEVDD
jgi:thymidylate synthase